MGKEVLDPIFLHPPGLMIHIFFIFLGVDPKPILFNVPAASRAVTAVQICTLYHGERIVCESVYPEPWFQMPLVFF